MNPRVSVALPVYNGSLTVGRAIRSIKQQTYAEWELIVVDDGSTDDTREILFAERADDARIRLKHGAHAGLVAALNLGLEMAQGDYIARMDADDESLPERLAEQAAYLDANPDIGLVSCLVEFGGDRALNHGYALHVDWINSLVTPEEIARRRFVEAPVAHPSVMFRRELVSRHGGYREGTHPEDYELWLRWLDEGVRMAKLPRALLRWNDTPRRLSRTDARYEAERFYALKAPWIGRWLAREGSLGDREVWVWGAGRPTRKRAEAVERFVPVKGYVDVDPKKITPAIGGTGRPVLAAADLPPPGKIFVLVYVGTRGAREWIVEHLRSHRYQEGRDFLLCA